MSSKTLSKFTTGQLTDGLFLPLDWAGPRCSDVMKVRKSITETQVLIRMSSYTELWWSEVMYSHGEWRKQDGGLVILARNIELADKRENKTGAKGICLRQLALSEDGYICLDANFLYHASDVLYSLTKRRHRVRLKSIAP